MPQELHQVAPAAPKTENLPGVGIAPEPLLHRQRQRVHAPAHVRHAARSKGCAREEFYLLFTVMGMYNSGYAFS